MKFFYQRQSGQWLDRSFRSGTYHLLPFHMRYFNSTAFLSLILCTTLCAEDAWKPLWNGKDLTGWSTWMQRPDAASKVPEIPRQPDGKYVEVIGSGRDPLKVFTVVEMER